MERPRLTFRRGLWRSDVGRLPSAVVALVALAVALAFARPGVVSADLPSRTPPSPTAASQPAQPRPEIGTIELRFEYSPGWQSAAGSWQDLAVVVQWQDGFGGWHDCDGWQGGLDAVTGGQATKTWWVKQPDFGKGPFRWMVRREAETLAVSEPFVLPTHDGQVVSLTAALR